MQKSTQKIQNRLNVFSGPDAVKDFLNPDCNAPLPLVEIPKHLNPFAEDGVRIFAKLMNFLPLANVKSLPAYNMLLEREKAGELGGVNSLIENSSGNTVFSLAVIGRFGVSKTRAIVSHEVTWGKLQMLRFFGTEIMVNEEPIIASSDKESGIYKAKQMGKRKGWFNPGQYDNEANPRAHVQWTGPQIWEQTEGKITVFCSGLGTTGTMVGTGKYLKEKSSVITRVGVARLPNNPVPGVRTPNLLREIAFDWKQTTDYLEEVGTKQSFLKSLELCRGGIVAGPSAGFALQGLLQFLSKQKEQDKLDSMKNEDGEIVAVFICPDSPFPYIDEYFEYLDASHFPDIEHEELLINKPGEAKPKKQDFERSLLRSISIPSDAYEMAYPISQKEVWMQLKASGNTALRENVSIIDIRPYNEFIHYHLPDRNAWIRTTLPITPRSFQKNGKAKKFFSYVPWESERG